jgi:hypothetical protein
MAFYQNFLESSAILEKQTEGLKTKPKEKVEKSFAMLLEADGRELHFCND